MSWNRFLESWNEIGFGVLDCNRFYESWTEIDFGVLD